MLVVKNTLASVREAGLIRGSGRSPGKGHGNPLQYSCLKNPMDRGTWQATDHSVTKSQTRWKRLSMHTSSALALLIPHILGVTPKSQTLGNRLGLQRKPRSYTKGDPQTALVLRIDRLPDPLVTLPLSHRKTTPTPRTLSKGPGSLPPDPETIENSLFRLRRAVNLHTSFHSLSPKERM